MFTGGTEFGPMAMCIKNFLVKMDFFFWCPGEFTGLEDV